jgi:hypothetical protein
MFKIISIGSHAALLVFFIYLQAQGASILGADEEKPQPGGQHNTYHK